MSQSAVDSEELRGPRISVETLVIAGLLGAVAIFLSVTKLGSIPVPNLSGNATIMHVPAILASTLGGPVAGLIVAFIWGASDFVQAAIPLWADPRVSILPRLFVGLTPWLAFVALKRWNLAVAFGVAGWVGTVTNTILVLTVAVLLKYIPMEAIPAIMPQAIAEQVLAVIITVAVGMTAVRVLHMRHA